MAKSPSTIEISLTDFVDFVSKSGKPKMTKVKEIKNRPDYHPSTDFYKAIREGIVTCHKAGKKKTALDTLLAGITDKKKQTNYPIAITGYKKFWGSKNIIWFEPPFKHWKTGDVDIKINPELGLDYGGKFLVVKLYLKSDKLTSDKVGQILSLMESQLRKKSEPEVIFGVLDVKNGKLFANDAKDVSFLPLLEGEVVSFETIWKAI